MGILSFFRRRTPKAPDTPAVAPTAAAAATLVGPAGPAGASSGLPSMSLTPVITEKATLLSAQGQYVFAIPRSATKQDVRRAVEAQYGVHVTAVATVNLPPKRRRRGRIVGEVAGARKAIVSLQSGEQIDLTK